MFGYCQGCLYEVFTTNPSLGMWDLIHTDRPSHVDHSISNTTIPPDQTDRQFHIQCHYTSRSIFRVIEAVKYGLMFCQYGKSRYHILISMRFWRRHHYKPHAFCYSWYFLFFFTISPDRELNNFEDVRLNLIVKKCRLILNACSILISSENM